MFDEIMLLFPSFPLISQDYYGVSMLALFVKVCKRDQSKGIRQELHLTNIYVYTCRSPFHDVLYKKNTFFSSLLSLVPLILNWYDIGINLFNLQAFLVK